MSPAVCAAAIKTAQQSGLSLQEWLDHRVSYAMSDNDVMVEFGLDAVAPWSLAAAELFVQVANSAPQALQGRWALLYERVKLDRSLWREPKQTVGEIEDGAEVCAVTFKRPTPNMRFDKTEFWIVIAMRHSKRDPAGPVGSDLTDFSSLLTILSTEVREIIYGVSTKVV